MVSSSNHERPFDTLRANGTVKDTYMMSKETANYGNWVPKKIIIALFAFGLVCLVIALVPVPARW